MDTASAIARDLTVIQSTVQQLVYVLLPLFLSELPLMGFFAVTNTLWVSEVIIVLMSNSDRPH